MHIPEPNPDPAMPSTMPPTTPADLPPATSSIFLQTAAARRKKLADLKTGILGDPTSMAPPDSDDSDSDSDEHEHDRDGDVSMGTGDDESRPAGKQEGAIAAAERAAVAKYLELTSVPTIEDMAKRIVDVAGKVQRSRAEQKQSDVADISELVPKKANADLKRELARRLGGLDKQTEVVMFELLRERIQSGGAGASDSHLAALIDSMYRQQRDEEGQGWNGSAGVKEGGKKWVSEWDQA